MAIDNLHHFLIHYFTSHNCRVLESNGGRLSVQLTEDMDRAIMNRPFYWHYIKKIGQAGEPAVLTFNTATSQTSDTNEEFIHYGSPRLQQILQHLTSEERFTRLFQTINTTNRTPLYPWLVINLKVSYTGKQHMDEMISIGLNLISGMMKSGMMADLEDLAFQTSIPDYCYTISPMIKLKSGFGRIEKVVLDYIKQQDHEWARTTLETKQEELQLLDHFYREMNEDTDQAEQMDKERMEINQRLSPAVSLDVANGGMFYLTDHPFADQ